MPTRASIAALMSAYGGRGSLGFGKCWEEKPLKPVFIIDLRRSCSAV
jgi:hypothetical protein